VKATAPQIGFDRFIDLDWAATALRVRAGSSELQELIDLIDATHAGLAAKKKTRTVLNRLWLEPRPDLIEFAERGIQLYREAPNPPVLALSWAMAITTYPFFGRVAEIVGRLTALQGDCTSVEVHRRMAEAYGEREGTRRMTNMVLQTSSPRRRRSRPTSGFIRTRSVKAAGSSRRVVLNRVGGPAFVSTGTSSLDVADFRRRYRPDPGMVADDRAAAVRDKR
jgi:hypothetical protein